MQVLCSDKRHGLSYKLLYLPLKKPKTLCWHLPTSPISCWSGLCLASSKPFLFQPILLPLGCLYIATELGHTPYTHVDGAKEWVLLQTHVLPICLLTDTKILGSYMLHEQYFLVHGSCPNLAHQRLLNYDQLARWIDRTNIQKPEITSHIQANHQQITFFKVGPAAYVTQTFRRSKTSKLHLSHISFHII